MSSRGRNEVRIIGGRWRGRKLRFPPSASLRPSPDRVRETLFNWLAPAIRDARCLDLFAGSGALGFEAASRGAASVVMVERDPRLVRYLEATAAGLGGQGLRVVRADALAWMSTATGPFDIVFLDPPFGAGLVPGLLERLDRPGWLAPDARVYVECAAADGEPDWPAGWRSHRVGRAGDVGYYLAVRTAGPAAGTAGVPGPVEEGEPQT